MNPDLLVLAGAGTPLLVALALVVVLALLLAVALLRARGRAVREREAARAEAAALRAQVEEIERRLASAVHERSAARPADPEFVITRVGEEPAGPRHAAGTAPGRVEPALFADLVLRESVVRVASLAHGLRVALSPEARNRIRFEVRREVRRARKQRRTDTKLARREHASRQRAALTDDEDAA